MTGHVAAKIARLVVVVVAVFFMNQLASAATCDRACLLDQIKHFNAAMLAHTPEKVRLTPGAQIRENTKAITFADSKWSIVKQILSEDDFTDPIKGNVVERVAGETKPQVGTFLIVRHVLEASPLE